MKVMMLVYDFPLTKVARSIGDFSFLVGISYFVRISSFFGAGFLTPVFSICDNLKNLKII